MNPELLVAIQNKDINWIRDFSKETPIADIAEAVSKLPILERVLLFRFLTTEDAGEVFSYLEHDIQEELVKNFSDDMLNEIVDEIYTDELVDLIEEMPQALAQRILKKLDVDKRKTVNLLLKYTDEQIGSLMSVDIVTLNGDLTSAEALKNIKSKRDDAELVHYYYVVDSMRRLMGAVTLEDIVFAKSTSLIKDIMFAVPSVFTTDEKESVAHIFAEHDMSVIPVLNSSNKVVGMVTSDDIIDVIQEEATEDMYKMAGISTDDVEEDYLKVGVWKIVKSRIFWLAILMLGSTLSQVVIQAFTDSMETNAKLKAVGLGVFISTIVGIIPVISGSAGNAGSQSATTITRALSLGEIDKKGYARQVLSKELRVGFIIGAILMILNFLRLMIYFMIDRQVLFDWNPVVIDETTDPATLSSLPKGLYIILISAASSIAMLIVIIFSKFLGSMIPLFAARMGKDPAVMSAPILATMTDATSTFIFFGITIVLFLALG